MESRFAGVPGLKSTFLAGDGRPYNVLLIVPDAADPVLADLTEAERKAYFQRVVRQANLDLAPYERVVEFAVLDREFSAEEGELTPKGSLRRKPSPRTSRACSAPLPPAHPAVARPHAGDPGLGAARPGPAGQ